MEIRDEAYDFLINEILLSKLISHKNGAVLIFFHESTNLGCKVEIKSFRNKYLQFKDIGWEIVGISTDLPEQLDELSKAIDLEFPLISDIDKSISRKFHVLGNGLSDGYLSPKSRRRTILIDNNMKVLQYFSKIIPVNHAEKVFDFISSILNSSEEKDSLKENVDQEIHVIEGNSKPKIFD